ncbi:MAG: hypothetical protein HQ471_01930 [Flavobacteriales bacterium]|jgi:signal transduction histidine kinase|nr:hypothetical protein [Flavobacteriales bacterium]
MMIENTTGAKRSENLENQNLKGSNNSMSAISINRVTSLNTAILESENEKKYFGRFLHNNLVQVLSSLNFYVDALLHPKNIKENSNQQFLKSIKDLSQDALDISLDVANSLISNSLSEENGLLNGIQILCEKLSRKHHLKIALELKFKESLLSIERKQQTLKISNDIILYLANTGEFRNFSLEYSLKY